MKPTCETKLALVTQAKFTWGYSAGTGKWFQTITLTDLIVQTGALSLQRCRGTAYTGELYEDVVLARVSVSNRCESIPDRDCLAEQRNDFGFRKDF